jgi:hypothetical protein
MDLAMEAREHGPPCPIERLESSTKKGTDEFMALLCHPPALDTRREKKPVCLIDHRHAVLKLDNSIE